MNESASTPGSAHAVAGSLCDASDLAYQNAILQHVSRTFALTIPQLPEALRDVVGNAYLLCRTADTIEDSEALDIAEKRAHYRDLLEIVRHEAPPDQFAAELPPRLTGSTLEAERDLVANIDRVVRVTHSFSPEQQAILSRCLEVMSEGMEQFQKGKFVHGLRDQRHMDSYCYYVAGCVGEMLTDLFCDYSPAIAARRRELSRLAVSFGQGLQMTNILKDIWEDRERDMCWLPRATFAEEGVDLADLPEARQDKGFERALVRLVAVATGHLQDALEYTLIVPKSEKGIRRFCLWAIGMAVLTLRKINKHRDFTAGAQVKISRRAVKATILMANAANGSNTALRLLFAAAARGLPRCRNV